MEDYHIHTNFSVCGLMHGGADYTFQGILSRLEGLDAIGFCDHVESFTDSVEFLAHVESIRRTAKENVFVGAEVSFVKSLEKLSIRESDAKKLDYLIGSVHTLPHFDLRHSSLSVHNKQKYDIFGREKLIAANIEAVRFMAEHVDTIGHPFSQFIQFGDYVGDTAIAEFARVVEDNALAEINLRVLRRSDYGLFVKYVERMKDEGCRFVLGSDAHCFEELDYAVFEKLCNDAGLKKRHIGRPVT